jgi:hypothetical protein
MICPYTKGLKMCSEPEKQLDQRRKCYGMTFGFKVVCSKTTVKKCWRQYFKGSK